LIPGGLLEVGIQTFGPLAKKLLFVVLTLGQVGLGGLIGALAGPSATRYRNVGVRAAAIASRSAGLALLVGGALITVLGGTGTLVAAATSLVVVAVVYGAALGATALLAARPRARGGDARTRDVWYPFAPAITRRGALTLAAGGAVAVAAVAVVGQSGSEVSTAPTPAATTPEVSPAPPASPTAVATLAPSPAAPAATAVAPDTPTSVVASVPAAPTPPATPATTPLALAFPKGESSDVTPSGDFYEVSKNFIGDPRVDAGSWKLQLAGLVEKPASFGLADLRAMPAVEKLHTLTCISNEVGGNLIGNAAWKGVRLADVLRLAGVKPGVRKVVLTAADGYQDSITLEKALDPGAVLAYEMNGAPLAAGHGFPLRLLVPDIYGMKNVKWLTKIELVGSDFQGYWQRGGWSDAAVIKTSSRIDVAKGTALGQPVSVAGIAFAGERGVRAVQLSADGGKTWQDARLERPNQKDVWTRWLIAWTPRARGSLHLLVRAIDGTGAVQTAEMTEPFPNGASGLHSVEVRIS
jgi:DMSO/TMAO reductase YedYZ molybdopterin-dependent catalytic subunit